MSPPALFKAANRLRRPTHGAQSQSREAAIEPPGEAIDPEVLEVLEMAIGQAAADCRDRDRDDCGWGTVLAVFIWIGHAEPFPAAALPYASIEFQTDGFDAAGRAASLMPDNLLRGIPDAAARGVAAVVLLADGSVEDAPRLSGVLTPVADVAETAAEIVDQLQEQDVGTNPGAWPCYMPTLAAIARATALIRASWGPGEYMTALGRSNEKKNCGNPHRMRTTGRRRRDSAE